MQQEELKKQYIEGIYQTGALLVKKESFTLHSGGQSHVYLNHRNFLTQGKYLDLVIDVFTKLIKNEISDSEIRLCTIDSVMSPILVGALSKKMGSDILVVREKKLEHGTKEDLYGNIGTGEIVIIDDMVSTGRLIINAVGKIREYGGKVNNVVACAYRNEDAVKLLSQNEIKLLSIASFSEIIGQLKGSIPETDLNLAINDQTIY